MGVYRAFDTWLGRSVALKVLPDPVARDPDRVARLQREARLLAALNDPHIAAIYGVEDCAVCRTDGSIVCPGLAGRRRGAPVAIRQQGVVLSVDAWGNHGRLRLARPGWRAVEVVRGSRNAQPMGRVSRRGRFLIAVPVGQGEPAPFTVTLAWQR
jgi:hypothetical protein